MSARDPRCTGRRPGTRRHVSCAYCEWTCSVWLRDRVRRASWRPLFAQHLRVSHDIPEFPSSRTLDQHRRTA